MKLLTGFLLKRYPLLPFIQQMTRWHLAYIGHAQSLVSKIPMQLAVVGVDNNRISKYITPPLSTVNEPKYTMGALIVEKLIDMMNENEYAEKRVFKVDSELLIRGSSDYKKNGQE